MARHLTTSFSPEIWQDIISLTCSKQSAIEVTEKFIFYFRHTTFVIGTALAQANLCQCTPGSSFVVGKEQLKLWSN
jgi:hypothetical protein